jgi:hypothetical protein
MTSLDLRPVIIASGQGFELVERVWDELRDVLLVGFVDPAFERDLEDSDPCLRGQARGRVCGAAPAQRVGERRGQCCELDQLAFLKLCVRNNRAVPGRDRPLSPWSVRPIGRPIITTPRGPVLPR